MKEDNQEIKDFEILKEIVNGKIRIEDVDLEIKKRLIEMCEKRLECLNDDIKKIKSNTEQVKEITKKLKNL